jgi:hypothetical protein
MKTFTESDVHRWGNLPHERSCKQAHLFHLGTGAATGNLSAGARLTKIYSVVWQNAWSCNRAFLFLLETLSLQTPTWTCNNCLSFHKLVALNKKVKVCCNKTVLKPTSVMKYEMPSKLNFLICRLEEAEKHSGPQILQTSHLSLFSVWIYEKFVHIVLRFISSVRGHYCKCSSSQHFNKYSKKLGTF